MNIPDEALEAAWHAYLTTPRTRSYPRDLAPIRAAIEAVYPYIREQLAKAWEEGAIAAWDVSTRRVNGTNYRWRYGANPANPYREEENE